MLCIKQISQKVEDQGQAATDADACESPEEKQLPVLCHQVRQQAGAFTCKLQPVVAVTCEVLRC